MNHIEDGDSQQIRDLLRILFEHYDKLPPAVAEAAVELSDFGGDVYNNEYLMRRGIGMSGISVYVDGEKTTGIEAGHPIGRRVVAWMRPDVVARSFWIVSNGEFICGWGEKPEINQ